MKWHISCQKRNGDFICGKLLIKLAFLSIITVSAIIENTQKYVPDTDFQNYSSSAPYPSWKSYG